MGSLGPQESESKCGGQLSCLKNVTQTHDLDIWLGGKLAEEKAKE